MNTTYSMNRTSRGRFSLGLLGAAVLVGAALLAPATADARPPRAEDRTTTARSDSRGSRGQGRTTAATAPARGGRGQAATRTAVHVAARRGPVHVSAPQVERRRPRGAKVVRVRGRTYWVRNGVFYEKTRRGYVVVRAPLGARLRMLPAAWREVSMGSHRYRAHMDVFYRWNARRGTWEVVTRPAGWPPHVRS